MKKIYPILILGLVLFAGSVFAAQTLVIGQVKYNDNPVNEANIEVTCHHLEQTFTQETQTGQNGRYSVLYPTRECDAGDTVEVTAEKKGISATGSAVVNPNKIGMLNLAMINFNVPEFGWIAATVALLGSGIGFLVLRRKQ
jgi:hypothetical protein